MFEFKSRNVLDRFARHELRYYNHFKRCYESTKIFHRRIDVFFIRGQRHASNGLRIQGRMVFIFKYVYVGYNDDFVLEFEDDANVENSIRAISPFRGFGRRN